MLEDGEEEDFGRRVLCHVAQHPIDFVGFSELHTNVLETMEHFLIVVLTMVLKDVQVSGEVVQLNLTQVLGGGGRGGHISRFCGLSYSEACIKHHAWAKKKVVFE